MELYSYLGGIIKNEGGIPLEIGGMPDHVHIACKFKPADSLSILMRKLKTNSSKWLNLNAKYVGRFSWQEGYGAFSVSESQVEKVILYIRHQEKHHKVLTFQEEYEDLLCKHGISFEKRFLWK